MLTCFSRLCCAFSIVVFPPFPSFYSSYCQVLFLFLALRFCGFAAFVPCVSFFRRSQIARSIVAEPTLRGRCIRGGGVRTSTPGRDGGKGERNRTKKRGENKMEQMIKKSHIETRGCKNRAPPLSLLGRVRGRCKFALRPFYCLLCCLQLRDIMFIFPSSRYLWSSVLPYSFCQGLRFQVLAGLSLHPAGCAGCCSFPAPPASSPRTRAELIHADRVSPMPDSRLERSPVYGVRTKYGVLVRSTSRMYVRCCAGAAAFLFIPHFLLFFVPRSSPNYDFIEACALLFSLFFFGFNV